MTAVLAVLDQLYWPAIVGHFIAFLILFLVLKSFFWKPMLEHLRRRGEKLAEEERAAAANLSQATELEEHFQQEVAVLEEKAYRETQETIQNSLSFKSEALSRTHEGSLQTISEARERLRAEKAADLDAAHQSVGELAREVLARILGEAPDREQVDPLVEKYLHSQGFGS